MARFNANPFRKNSKLHIGSVRCRVFNGKGVYPYSWRIAKTHMSFTDGDDYILHINLGYAKVEITWML